MFRRKLLALDYYRADNLDVSKDDDFRSLVIWTEDQKIRHYKIEDRGALRDLDNPHWEDAFDKYWKDVGFPVDWREMERTQVSLLFYTAHSTLSDCTVEPASSYIYDRYSTIAL